MAGDGKAGTHGRTFSFRACLVGVVAMLAAAMWVHFHEVIVGEGIVGENSPPAAAVGIFVAIILVGAVVTKLAPRLRLQAGELIVIYAMLVTSVPLMSQGMWHRFLGFVVAIPHNKPNSVLLDSFSEKLWPHGPHLVENRRFERGLGDGVSADPPHSVRQVRTDASPVGAAAALELFNEPRDDVAPEDQEARLSVHVPRMRNGREVLVPGERYFFGALFRLADMASPSRLDVDLISDGGETVPILSWRRDTEETFSAAGAFLRKFEPYVNLPRDIDQAVDLVFTLQGPGRVAITDVGFFSNEAIARLHKGSLEIRESDLGKLPQNSRDSLVVRPDNLLSPAGIWYTVKGYVPYRQWAGPLTYWIVICLAVFFCLLGVSVIFRRQWAENERFAFPMVVLPRLLLEQKDEGGRLVRPLFRKRTFRAGVIVAFVYCLMQGLAFYIPGMPDPTVNVDLTEYFASPAVKAYINGMYSSNFTPLLLMVSIAFFVDLEMLLSILIFYWVVKIPWYFGEVFGWKSIKGPLDAFPFPHEQHIGAFLALAFIVLWVSRKHLRGVWLRLFRRPGGVDDSVEAMSYRSALGLILASFAVFGVWGQVTGLGAGSSLLFFGFIVVCGLSASRIRTECGAPFTYFTPYFPYLIFFLLGGLQVFGTQTMLLAYCAGGFMAVAQFLMFAPSQVEMMHLGNQFDASPRGVKWGLIFGMLGGVLLGGYVMLVWAYGVGGENVPYMKNWAMRQDWYLNSLRGAVTDADTQALSAAAQGTALAPAYPALPLGAAGFGLVLTVVLTMLRARFVGFWLHPIGYVLANSYFAYMTWGSLLVAWVVKALALKVGGPRLIRDHMTPLFAGVFCGCLCGIVLWNVVAAFGISQGVRELFGCFP